MSKYTTEVRFICENAAGLVESAGYSSINNVLADAAPKVFDFDFPIFDEAYRLPLEIKILKHYYTREIGAESVGLWKLWLDATMNEIMPFYNELYESALLKYDPLLDVDYIRAGKGGSTHAGSASVDDKVNNQGTIDNTNTSNSRIDNTSHKTDIGSENVDKDMSNTSTYADSENQVTNEERNGSGSVNTTNANTVDVSSDYDTTSAGSTNSKTHSDTTGDNELKKSGTVKVDDDTTTTDDGETSNNRNQTTANTDNSFNKYSDTPQGSLENVVNGRYLTTATVVENDNNGALNEDGKGTSKNTNIVDGTVITTNDTTDKTDYSEIGNTTSESDENSVQSETGVSKEQQSGSENVQSSDNQTISGSKQNDSNGIKKDTGNTKESANSTLNSDVTGNQIGSISSVDNTKHSGSSVRKNESSEQFVNAHDYIEHIKGKTHGFSYAKAIAELRENILNIDMMIIEELSDLFMKVW